MTHFLIRWFVLTLAIFIVANLFHLIYIENFTALILASLILGILNAIVRPILIFLTLPINILSLGFFILVINAFLLFFVSRVVGGFEIASFWKAFWAALLITVISAVLNHLVREKH
ncbi:MAG TPA: phage holin family protein [Terriglobales bacterium]|nr:phage holin family protein [Terriglobales bacterium]